MDNTKPGMADSAGMSRMSMDTMMMTFYSSLNTPIYTSLFSPDSTSDYIGICFFLILLSILLRSLYAFKSILESKWIHQEHTRRHIQVASKSRSGKNEKPTEAGSAKPKTATLTTSSAVENVKLVEYDDLMLGLTNKPWRLSVDLPRAVLVTVMLGIGYLLMLAVMTMNVGYFMSVLGGAFVGELLAGRYAQHVADHH